MSTLKILYNGSEISSVDATSPTSVTYNNSTIATLNDRDTKTLGCHGKVMASDVVIGSKTLNCNGKLMQGDIVVELVGSATSGKTWYFNDTIDKCPIAKNVNFKSKGIAYVKFVEEKSGPFDKLSYYKKGGGTTNVYNYKNSSWRNEAYRTIVLDEPATGDVLAFLEANATKLS